MNAPNTPSSRALVALPFGHSHSHMPRTPSSQSIPSSHESPSAADSGSVQDQGQWQPILHASNQVVLYNPRSHALSITSASASETLASGVVVARRIRREEETIASTSITGETCPYCKQSLPVGFRGYTSARTNAREGGREDVEGGDDDERWGYLDTSDDDEESGEFEAVSTDPAYHARASDYFRLLAIVNETSSTASGSRRPSLSPSGYRTGVEGYTDNDRWSHHRTRSRGRRSRTRTRTPENRSTKGAFPADKMAEGYFKTFFQEEYKLGMGANGSVFLCQHVLDGNSLGHFAVKKIAVGESHSYLLKILREVRLLERLHHPNIITYHHAWLETSQFSSFGPKVPTLHVLMQWAEGGSLDDFIDVRLGRKPAHIHMHPDLSSSSSSVFQSSVPPSPASLNNELPCEVDGEAGVGYVRRQHGHEAEATQPQLHASSKPEDPQSRAARIKAFRAYQRAPPEEKERMRQEMEGTYGGDDLPSQGTSTGRGRPKRGEWTPVHLLSAEEVKSLFCDVVAGLGFLHDRSILHLDLKPGNVLLTWDEGQLIPRAMLSDFGTSRDMINSSRRARSGNTGTLEYTAPESLPSPQTGLLQQIDSKADMWSLGMILHKILFFKLPYRYAAMGDANGEPISQNGEGEKMDKLEEEVLGYPGFKSNPELVTGFEARRLPRAFLVLLESLLHKNPVSRPSCERVNAAIRQGKFDSLGDLPLRSLPLSRPRTDMSATASPTAAEESSKEVAPFALENSLLLALPSSMEVLGPEEGSWRSWFSWNGWTRFVTGIIFRRDIHRRQKKRRVTIERELKGRGGMAMRLIRSSLLVVKILTIPRVCPNPMSRPRPVVVALLLAAAVADTVIDHDAEPSETSSQVGRGRVKMGSRMRGVWVTVGLGLLHVGVLGLSALAGGWEVTCCIPLDTSLRRISLGL